MPARSAWACHVLSLKTSSICGLVGSGEAMVALLLGTTRRGDGRAGHSPGRCRPPRPYSRLPCRVGAVGIHTAGPLRLDISRYDTAFRTKNTTGPAGPHPCCHPVAFQV